MINGTETEPSIEKKSEELTVEKYSLNSWPLVREEIMAVEAAAFNNTGYSESLMGSLFEDPDNLNYLLKDPDGKIIGYTQVALRGDIAYIMNTALAPEHQGKGKVAKLMQPLEEELKNRGVKFLTRDSSIENGYADKIQKHYGDRILETSERPSPWGLQRHFKIKL